MTAPLDWSGLVEEALRRRRVESLTQKEHAALAGVSVPTLIVFECKKTSLSLTKALAILKVVGLVAEQSPSTSQDVFVEAVEQRWLELVSGLATGAPARQLSGYYVFDYEIADASISSATALLEALRKAVRKYTGWPPFWLPTSKRIAPYPFDGGAECWLGQPDKERTLNDTAHSDFWRAAVDARLYLRRGFQEDVVDVLTPATVFDQTLPVWRTGEVMLHAHHLAEGLDVASDSKVKFRVQYAGLSGRELKSWANPHRAIFKDYRCRTGEATATVSCRVSDLSNRLPELVHELLVPIYERFDFFKLPAQLVEEELDKLRNDRSHRGENR